MKARPPDEGASVSRPESPEHDDEVVSDDAEAPRLQSRISRAEAAAEQRRVLGLEDFAEYQLLDRRREQLLVELDPLGRNLPVVLHDLERDASQRIRVGDKAHAAGLELQRAE